MLSNANATSIRLLNYPPLTGEESDLGKSVTRCGVHTDYGGITLLFQVIIPHIRALLKVESHTITQIFMK